jgi:mannosyltransferase
MIVAVPQSPARAGDVPADRAHMPRQRGVLLLAWAGIMGVAAVLRFWRLGHQGLWYDEAVTAWLLRGTPRQLLAALPHSESTPPGFYLVAWSWVRAFGDTAVGLRSLSATAGTLTVPVVFATGRALAGRRVGLIAAALVAVNPLLVWYSQEARAYALLVLVSTLSLWLFVRARTRPTLGRLLAWALAAAVALCTHYFALFVVAPEALVLLAARRARLGWRLLALLLVGGVATSLLGLALAQRARTYWFVELPLGARVRQIAEQFMVGFSPPAARWAVIAAAACLVVALVLLAVRAQPHERCGAAMVAAVGAGGVGLPFALALAGSDYLNTRNVIGALVPFTLVAATGLGSRRAGVVGLLATGVLAAVCITTVMAVVRDPLAQRPRWQQVAAALAPIRQRRAILLRGSPTWARPLGFYLPRTWWLPPRGASVAEIDVLRRMPTRHDCPRQTWWGALCDVGAEPPLTRAPARGFHLRAVRRVAGFEVSRYLAPRRVRLYPHPPLEQWTRRDEPPGYSVDRKLLLTPTRSPVVP